MQFCEVYQSKGRLKGVRPTGRNVYTCQRRLCFKILNDVNTDISMEANRANMRRVLHTRYTSIATSAENSTVSLASPLNSVAITTEHRERGAYSFPLLFGKSLNSYTIRLIDTPDYHYDPCPTNGLRRHFQGRVQRLDCVARRQALSFNREMYRIDKALICTAKGYGTCI